MKMFSFRALSSVGIVALLVATGFASTLTISPKIQPKLAEALLQNPGNIIITFQTGTKAVLDRVRNQTFADRTALLNQLTDQLDYNSVVSQQFVRAYLNATGWAYEPIWATDQMFIRSATMELISTLAAFPDVLSIMQDEQTLFTDPPATSGPFRRSMLRGREQRPMAEWGIEKIQAEEALEFLTNLPNVTTGEIRIATIDTGVRYTHESLLDNYLGEYGWFDPANGTPMPNDQNGHGTHVTGTICGIGGIGVYPNAKWLACKGCATSMCAMSDLLRCGQFVLCPTLADGTKKDCSKAPHVVSNSWGVVPEYNEWYDDIVAAWNVGKILPVFANGNAGPSCGTAGYPGTLPGVIAVGATTSADNIASFSSVGPTLDMKIKPDVSAPGAAVVSASHLSDDGYRSLSGTSMACPHVAGVTALLFKYKEDLSFDEMMQALIDGVETEPLTTSGRTCDGLPDTVFPNHIYGNGRVNVLKSLQSLM